MGHDYGRGVRTVRGVNGGNIMPRELSTKCDYCRANMVEYQLYDRDGEPTGEWNPVCPNEWRGGHP